MIVSQRRDEAKPKMRLRFVRTLSCFPACCLWKRPSAREKKFKSYVGDNKSYVGISNSYIEDKRSYIGDSNSYVGDNNSYVGRRR